MSSNSGYSIKITNKKFQAARTPLKTANAATFLFLFLCSASPPPEMNMNHKLISSWVNFTYIFIYPIYWGGGCSILSQWVDMTVFHLCS